MNRLRPTPRRLMVAAVALSALAASACVGPSAGGLGPEPLTPTSRYSLQVEPGLDRIALAVHDQGLSGNQHAALRDLVGRFARSGAPALVIEAPAGNDAAASQMAWAARTALEHQGVPSGLIQVVGYAGPDARAPVLIGFETVRAVVPQCGTEWGNLSRNFTNTSTANFGCAVTANLAAQIANPRDIVQPRDMTPTDPGRRSVVFDNYRKGERTAAEREMMLQPQRISQSVQ